MLFFVAEMTEEAKEVWEKRGIKILIGGFVFPVLLLVIHQVLLIPAIFFGFIMVHFVGDPKLWGTLFSAVALLLAGWGAVATCKLIWPKP